MVEDYGLPNEVASEIRMQSQRMVLVRLESTDGNPVGVLVVESTDHRMLSLKKQDEIVGSEIYPLLCQVVQSIKDPHLTAFSQ